MISAEELDLICSFKRQLSEKIEYFAELQKDVHQKEQELLILNTKYESDKARYEREMDEYKKTLERFRDQIEFEKAALKSEEIARNNYILRSQRNSKTLQCLPAQVPLILLCRESAIEEN